MIAAGNASVYGLMQLSFRLASEVPAAGAYLSVRAEVRTAAAWYAVGGDDARHLAGIVGDDLHHAVHHQCKGGCATCAALAPVM